jgi:hypothetical protein
VINRIRFASILFARGFESGLERVIRGLFWYLNSDGDIGCVGAVGWGTIVLWL